VPQFSSAEEYVHAALGGRGRLSAQNLDSQGFGVIRPSAERRENHLQARSARTAGRRQRGPYTSKNNKEADGLETD